MKIQTIIKYVKGWIQSHHSTMLAMAVFVYAFANDAYNVYLKTGHISRTDLQSIGITLLMGSLKSAFEIYAPKKKPTDTSDTSNTDTPTGN
jgi:hypothetical protein